MVANNSYLAVCGLDCEACEIRRAPFDDEAAQAAVAWYRRMGWLQEGEGIAEALARGMVCQGCRGDRSAHWSPDCWILRCCVDDRGLDSCHLCRAFPCQPLIEWSTQNESYAHALARLQQMAES